MGKVDMTRLGVLLGLLLTAMTAGVGAHHASSGLYDNNTIGEVEGEVSRIFWRNPHVRISITRIGENGEEETWEVEFGSVNTLERIGVSRDLVQVGDRVQVSGSLGRNGLKAMFADSITLPDGEELPLQAGVERRYGLTESAIRSARNVDAALRADIFRVWLPKERPRTGEGTTRFPLTETGRASKAEWDPAEDPALRCIPPGLPTAMDNPYPIEFRDQGDTIILLLEEWDGIRTIHMSNAGSGAPAQPRMGYSVGRWNGNILIIETTDIGWRYIDDLGTPQSEDAVIAERFTLSQDGTSLAWEARITDPVNFTDPVVMEGVWVWVPGHEIKPFNCTLPDQTR
jgi:hypothetical protein